MTDEREDLAQRLECGEALSRDERAFAAECVRSAKPQGVHQIVRWRRLVAAEHAMIMMVVCGMNQKTAADAAMLKYNIGASTFWRGWKEGRADREKLAELLQEQISQHPMPPVALAKLNRLFPKSKKPPHPRPLAPVVLSILHSEPSRKSRST